MRMVYPIHPHQNEYQFDLEHSVGSSKQCPATSPDQMTCETTNVDGSRGGHTYNSTKNQLHHFNDGKNTSPDNNTFFISEENAASPMMVTNNKSSCDKRQSKTKLEGDNVDWEGLRKKVTKTSSRNTHAV